MRVDNSDLPALGSYSKTQRYPNEKPLRHLDGNLSAISLRFIHVYGNW
jgi:hypothetical protein